MSACQCPGPCMMSPHHTSQPTLWLDVTSGGSLASAGGAVVYNGSTATAAFVLDADIGVPVLECQKVPTVDPHSSASWQTG